MDLSAIQKVLKQVMVDRPDFVCFPEICASSGPLAQGIEHAPDLESFSTGVGELAKEANVNLVVPFIERSAGRAYNSVPIVERTGRLAMVYRKNYPTVGELQAGLSPGSEVPVAECDGVRVGAAVCFDANFPQVAAALERQRARLVFWPSMYPGGQLLEHWALRYGFHIVVSSIAESAVIDMGGRSLRRGSPKPHWLHGRRGPAWATAEVNADRDVFHLDSNQDRLPAIRAQYGADVDIETFRPEAYFHLASNRLGLSVEAIAHEFELETLRDYLARSARERGEHLAPPSGK